MLCRATNCCLLPIMLLSSVIFSYCCLDGKVHARFHQSLTLGSFFSSLLSLKLFPTRSSCCAGSLRLPGRVRLLVFIGHAFYLGFCPRGSCPKDVTAALLSCGCCSLLTAAARLPGQSGRLMLHCLRLYPAPAASHRAASAVPVRWYMYVLLTWGGWKPKGASEQKTERRRALSTTGAVLRGNGHGGVCAVGTVVSAWGDPECEQDRVRFWFWFGQQVGTAQ